MIKLNLRAGKVFKGMKPKIPIKSVRYGFGILSKCFTSSDVKEAILYVPQKFIKHIIYLLTKPGRHVRIIVLFKRYRDIGKTNLTACVSAFPALWILLVAHYALPIFGKAFFCGREVTSDE